MHATSILDHTFHLHGHKFQIVEYGPAFNAPDEYIAKNPVRRFKDAPLKRDTLKVNGFQYIKIRFKADNPGVWLFHCHMDVHFYMGLAVMFIEAPLELQKTITMPEEINQLCRDLNVKTSGNGAGNAGFNMTGLPVL
ncbi:hypothetical protein LPJ72_006010 [Coemansia sp. Benny D160-2]|nr:hypothetical protein LPJ72_006010 [Coemansia sp. Benny D160-2]